MMINVQRLKTFAANCRRFADVARDESARAHLIDMAREFEVRAAEVEALDVSRCETARQEIRQTSLIA